MKNKWSLKKIILWSVVIFSFYHVIFGGARILIDSKYPNGWYDNTVVAFGTHLRNVIFSISERCDIWVLRDTQPEIQDPNVIGFSLTPLDENVYAYEVEMGWFYQYKTFYVYGRNGFWIIQADPFHITLLRNPNIPEEDARELDKTIAQYKPYGDQFTVIQNGSELTKRERKEYAKLKEKAQPRIEELKELGLYP